MSTPTRPIPRKFYRVAYQRFEEAEVLFEAGYYIGAVYLAGYAIECILKTLILEATPEQDHAAIEAEFRGQLAHDYEWLRHRYVQTRAPGWPADISQALTFVGTCETSLRYTPGVGDCRDASRFLAEARKIIAWQIVACREGNTHGHDTARARSRRRAHCRSVGALRTDP